MQQPKLLALGLLPPLELCCGLGEDICEYGQRWMSCRRAVYSFIQDHALCQAPLVSMGCANFIGHSFIFNISILDTKLGPMVLSLLFSGGGTP